MASFDITCRKCGASMQDGASLKRVNSVGEKGIWECLAECGVPFISEDAALLYAMKLAEEEADNGSSEG